MTALGITRAERETHFVILQRRLLQDELRRRHLQSLGIGVPTPRPRIITTTVVRSQSRTSRVVART